MLFSPRRPTRAALLLLVLAAWLSSAASWPEYLGNGQHTAASSDAATSAANAAQLLPLWSFQTGGVVAAEPVVVQGTVYVGSWDGNEYALDAATGALKWKTFLGKTAAAGCVPPAAGITSTAAVSDGVVYVGGGDAFWYALDAATGAVLWKVPTGDNSPAGGHYNWSSPLLYHGYAYIGIASFGDCPLVQGQLLQVNLATHRVVHTLNLVPNGQVGAGVWTSPAVDPASNTIFLTSGSDEGNVPQPFGQAIVAVNASTLAIVGHWTLPAGQAIDDSDWGDSPLLASGPTGRPLLFATNKNGYVYGFDRANLGAGYQWRTPIADPGTCPVCGDTSVSSGAFGQGRLYVGGGHAAVAGRGRGGTVRAIDPTSGAILWTHAAPGPVIGPLAYANGLLIDGGGPTLEVLDAATGERLYSWNSAAQIYGGPTVAAGVIYASSTSGLVFALRLPAHPTAFPADAHCPAGWSCTDLGSAAGQEQATSSGWDIGSAGAGLAGTVDQARLITQTASGNTSSTAQIAALPAAGSAGVTLRQARDASAANYTVLLTAGEGLTVQERSADGGPTTVLARVPGAAAPLYLRAQRRGDEVQAATSNDGLHYTLVPGSSVLLPMPQRLLAGAVASTPQGGAASVAGAQVGPAISAAPAPASTGCPAGWRCRDIGNPAPPGVQSGSLSQLTVLGAGADIFGARDAFHFVWRPLAGNGAVSARLSQQSYPNDYAKAGPMLRAGVAADAAFYALLATPGHGSFVEERALPGGTALVVTAIPTLAAPSWLRVLRAGNTLSAQTSADGASWATIAGSAVTVDAASALAAAARLDAGVAVTSHVAGTAGSATFTNVQA